MLVTLSSDAELPQAPGQDRYSIYRNTDGSEIIFEVTHFPIPERFFQ